MECSACSVSTSLASFLLGGVGFSIPGDLSGLPLEGEAAERFLRSAQIVEMKPIGEGITRPERVTLTDGEQTWHAVWKMIDDFRPGVIRAEWILLSKIDGRRSLKAIAAAADLSIFHTGRLLYGLVSTKLIRLRKPGEGKSE